MQTRQGVLQNEVIDKGAPLVADLSARSQESLLCGVLSRTPTNFVSRHASRHANFDGLSLRRFIAAPSCGSLNGQCPTLPNSNAKAESDKLPNVFRRLFEPAHFSGPVLKCLFCRIDRSGDVSQDQPVVRESLECRTRLTRETLLNVDIDLQST